MKRQSLINIVVKYNGEYNLIINAINNNEIAKNYYLENVITIFDDIYPKELLALEYPPYALFYKGNLDLLKGKKISVVGSRNASKYASIATKNLILNNQDKIIVSGLAKGIDAIAHEYANKTIGILGCGIDYIYPKENINLYEKIIKEGLLLSEYPYDTKPYSKHFPFRNRIISALGEELYVMQSSKKSGTMSTINYALELGKNIKVLPYGIFDADGRQNNLLIKEGADIIDYDEIDISNRNVIIY